MLRKCSFILLIVNEGINLIFLFYLPESPTTATMGDGCKLFVYGVDQNMSNEEIKDEFEKFGMVSDVYNTGKGFAFVTFDRKEDAETATMGMDGQTLAGQQIKVIIYYFFTFQAPIPRAQTWIPRRKV